MKSYLGITAHVIEQRNVGSRPDEVTCQLQQLLLSYQKLAGSHTGENIVPIFENIQHSNDIKNSELNDSKWTI